MTELASARVAADEAGYTSIVVGGVDLTRRVQSVSIHLRPGQPAVLILQATVPTVEFDGLAATQVQIPTEEASIEAFLDSIDPEELSEVVLEGADLGSLPPIHAALEILKQRARG